MKVHRIKFSGALIERGFWLYVWRVSQENRVALYVGRTGDSSSKYAASPFNRLGQHLDIRPKATANTLLRNLKNADFDPTYCEYELISIGPLYPEQSTLEDHRKYRDIVAPLESALAQHLKNCGHVVLGKHPKQASKDEELFNKVLSMLEGKL